MHVARWWIWWKQWFNVYRLILVHLQTRLCLVFYEVVCYKINHTKAASNSRQHSAHSTNWHKARILLDHLLYTDELMSMSNIDMVIWPLTSVSVWCRTWIVAVWPFNLALFLLDTTQLMLCFSNCHPSVYSQVSTMHSIVRYTVILTYFSPLRSCVKLYVSSLLTETY